MLKKLNLKNILDYLIDVGICTNDFLYSININPQHSNSLTWIINIINQENLINLVIKQEQNNQPYRTPEKINNERQFYRVLQQKQDLICTASLAPEILHVDDINLIVVYKYNTNYINLEKYYVNHKAFPIAIAEIIGKNLAKMHFETQKGGNYYGFLSEDIKVNVCSLFSSFGYLIERIYPENLSDFPSEGYRFLSYYQRDESLKAAVTELVVNHSHFCLTHNNLQLNNILIPIQLQELLSKKQSDTSTIKVINWDNCSWGDPALDLGTVIAGYLLLWSNSLIVHPTIELEKSLQLARIPLEFVQPSILALTRTYISNFPNILEEYPNFIKRIIQFTGIALISNILETIQFQKDFNNRGICHLQLAKSLLCQPEKSFSSIFGITKLV